MSGCDYVSFFSEIGKATFLRYFFQYASFITSSEDQLTPGTLADTDLEGTAFDAGFLAFLRLIGTVYYKKHASGFDTPSHATHYLRFTDPTLSIKQCHFNWLADIRDNIWNRIRFENQMIPSTDALYFHWQRACLVMNMWGQSDKNRMTLLPLQQFGWRIDNEELTIVWDTEENIKAIHDRVDVLLKGCKCTTGCSTGRCSCKRKSSTCMEGCQCINCNNLQVKTPQERDQDIANISIEEDMTSDTEQTEDLMDWVFGEALLEDSLNFNCEPDKDN